VKLIPAVKLIRLQRNSEICLQNWFFYIFFVSAKLEQRVSTLEDENTTFVYGGCTLCV